MYFQLQITTKRRFEKKTHLVKILWNLFGLRHFPSFDNLDLIATTKMNEWLWVAHVRIYVYIFYLFEFIASLLGLLLEALFAQTNLLLFFILTRVLSYIASYANVSHELEAILAELLQTRSRVLDLLATLGQFFFASSLLFVRIEARLSSLKEKKCVHKNSEHYGHDTRHLI